MVRAILAGTKTQTRRAIKPVGNDEGFVLQDYGNGFWPYRSEDGECGFYRDRNGYDTEERIKCPYGRPGDRLWVRETWAQHGVSAAYRADSGDRPAGAGMWRPSIHMPRWASRITLEVTDVKVERLQDISRGDAMAEGCPFPNMAQGDDPRAWYAHLWESINGPGSWDANPWVWCVSFKRLEAA